jgi:hypothetical protein
VHCSVSAQYGAVIDCEAGAKCDLGLLDWSDVQCFNGARCNVNCVNCTVHCSEGASCACTGPGCWITGG